MWNYNRSYFIPPSVLNPDGINTIAIRSYAAYDPKFADIPVIGRVEDIHRLRIFKNTLSQNIPLSTGIMISLLGILGIIFFLVNRKNKNQLLFGITGLLWGILSIHYYNHDFSIYYNLKEKIFFTLLAAEIGLIYFLLERILDIRVKILEAAVIIFTLIIAAFCFSYPLHDHMYGKGYSTIGILAIIEQLMWGYLIIRALYHKKKNALIAGLGYFLFMLGVIHDSLAITGLYIIDVYFISFSYPVLIGSFALIFIRDFSIIQERLRFMDEIAEKNRIITSQKRELESRNIDLEDDLKFARIIQENFIPRKMPDKNIHALYRPMEAIGGDFYDFIYFDDPDLIGIFISDVSGHGTPAALITAMLKGYLDRAGDLLKEPARLMHYLNDALFSLSGTYFITVFYGIYNKRTNELKYINAGHPVPYLLKENSVSSLLGRRSLPIAIFSSRILNKKSKQFHVNTAALVKGSRIIFYTDGLIEERNVSAPFRDFESTELLPVLMKLNRSEPSGVIEEIYRELVKFKGNEIFEDDVCIICMDVI